jgi:hypothetical protein
MIAATLNKDPEVRGFPHLCTDLIVGRFVEGHFLIVSRKSAKYVDLEQLEDLDEVWALCFRKPRPGCLG